MRQVDTNEKLMAAGFRIIRPDDYPSPRIKEWVGDSAWNTLEKFETKTARDRRIKELLQNDKIVVL